MKELLKEFIEWSEYNLTDTFELWDSPDEVIKRFLEERE